MSDPLAWHLRLQGFGSATRSRLRDTHPTHACGTAIRGLDEIPIASRMVSCGAIGEDPRLRADAIGIVRGAGR